MSLNIQISHPSIHMEQRFDLLNDILYRLERVIKMIFDNGTCILEEWSGIETTSNNHIVNAGLQICYGRNSTATLKCIGCTYGTWECHLKIPTLFIDLGQ